MRVLKEQLQKFLEDSGLVSRSDLEKAAQTSETEGSYLGDVLVREGHLTTDELRKTEAYILGIPFISLKGQKLDFEVLSLIPEPIARNHNIVAFKKNPDSLEVAMLDTEDLTAIDFIKKKVKLKILPRLSDEESIKSALAQYQKSLQAEFGEIIQKEAGAIEGAVSQVPEEGEMEEGVHDLKKLAEDIPIVRIVDTLLHHAILQGASDIHIEPMEKEMLVRYRITVFSTMR